MGFFIFGGLDLLEFCLSCLRLGGKALEVFSGFLGFYLPALSWSRLVGLWGLEHLSSLLDFSVLGVDPGVMTTSQNRLDRLALRMMGLSRIDAELSEALRVLGTRDLLREARERRFRDSPASEQEARADQIRSQGMFVR